ncbi:MAG: methionine synthase [Peptococcaceae bacterium]|nr:methionine synthase [Peptococcaceae bacterium]
MDHSKEQILRYLGRHSQEIPPHLDVLIEECMCLMRDAMIQAPPHHIYHIYDLVFPVKGKPKGEPARDAEGISVKNTRLLLPGTAIRRHLSGCHQVVLLAATLGVAADTLIRRWQTIDLTRSLILDACATQCIEHCCDEAESLIRHHVQEDNLLITPRFSPGYGDLPLDLQPTLLAILDAEKKIGLTCTQSLILLPRKSVTALIGLRQDQAAKGVDFRKTADHITFQKNTPSPADCSSIGCANCSLKAKCLYQESE